MEQSARIGSVEIELRNVGTVHLKLPVNDVKQLMEFVRTISTGWASEKSSQEDSARVRSIAISSRAEHPTTLQASGSAQPRRLAPSPIQQTETERRRQAIEQRIDDLESKIASLIEMNKELIQSLSPEKRNREPRIPSQGTKYFEVLQELVERFGSNTFEGNQVSSEKRHVLSILNNKYNALEVVETRGRTNIYRIRKEIMERILTTGGTSTIVEIRGKDRKSCDAFLETNQKRYPGFTYAFIEGNGLRQKYRLFFKDSSVQLSVTSNLSRFVGSKTNLIVREA